jgi:N-acetylneuraminic acid mutarotase
MIIWGGFNHSSYLNDGARYNLAANTWIALPAAGTLGVRAEHTAVWTGTEMIIWGGSDGISYLNDGGRYNPAADAWTALPTSGAPTGRYWHTAVWTGTEMIVWGGAYWNGGGYTYCNDGGRYNPTANIWTALSTSGAPAGRDLHTTVWTGSEMIVWGGYNGSYLNDGGRYNPAANSWTALPTAGAPAARCRHTALWTGSQMIVWGGYNGSAYFSDTWSYYPYAPAVRICWSSPTSAVVAWPVWYPSLRLCQTTDLGAGNWTIVTNAVTQVGAENYVTVSPQSGGQFFRVEYP